MEDEKYDGEQICRQKTVNVFTEHPVLACSALATVWIFSVDHPNGI